MRTGRFRKFHVPHRYFVILFLFTVILQKDRGDKNRTVKGCAFIGYGKSFRVRAGSFARSYINFFAFSCDSFMLVALLGRCFDPLRVACLLEAIVDSPRNR